MTLYRYEAIDAGGRPRRGEVEASSLTAALGQLRTQGLSPFRAEPAADRAGTLRLTSFGGPDLAWRARFIRQLATLLGAGIALDRGLSILIGQARKAAEQRVVTAILEAISGGSSLAQALAKCGGGFRTDEVGLIQAGEQAGSLQQVLEELAGLLERRLTLRAKLTSALVYPAFLMALAPLSLVIIATVLVPNIAPLFENSGAQPPIVLRLMMGLSRSLRDDGALWAGAMILMLVLGLMLARSGHLARWGWKLATSLPVLRSLIRRAEAARICRTLGSLLRGGSALQSALTAVAAVAVLPDSKRQLAEIRNAVAGGEKLKTALGRLTVLTPSVVQMIAIGEEAAKLDAMLSFVAETEENDLTTAIDRLMNLLTPLLTVLMGLMIGGIVMSIMRAILSVNELAVR